MLLEIKDIVKVYKGKVRANDSISLSVTEGEVFGLLGPNGAGIEKSLKNIVVYQYASYITSSFTAKLKSAIILAAICIEYLVSNPPVVL